MIKYITNKKATSVVEYTTLIVIVIAVTILMMQYFSRGNMGRWKNAGDSIGFRRQYDPDRTTEVFCNGDDCQTVP